MRFLADMGVGMRVVHWLRTQGYDAVHLLELGLERLPDSAIFERAAAEQRIIPTFDLDFGEISALIREKRIGVVIFRLRNTRVEHVIVRLQSVLWESLDALDEAAIVLIEETRYRVRRFPAGPGA